jgi:hypothetical protein
MAIRPPAPILRRVPYRVNKLPLLAMEQSAEILQTFTASAVGGASRWFSGGRTFLA